jgi:Co/Zn/Cd efflux system component
MDGHDLAAHAHHETEGEHNKSGERRTRWVVALTAVMMVGERWRSGRTAGTWARTSSRSG